VQFRSRPGSEDENTERRTGRGDRRTGRRDRRTKPNRYSAELSNSRALLAAMEMHDPATACHSRNTVRFAVAVAERLGLDADSCTEVRLVAMLHDVGKLASPTGY
jgi:HD-GYP domain-containing protein (c-di-GMP phosphodiesterase class II)